MLVLSRRVGERILIGDKIAITVVRINGTTVRIGIEAPEELAVFRDELAYKSVDSHRARADEQRIEVTDS